jgi:hypothetical protein
MDLALFEHAVSERTSEWAVKGITAVFHAPSDEERLRSNWAAHVAVESGTAGGDLAIWTSGDAELLVVYASDGSYRTDHYDLADIAGIDSCLDDLTALMLTRPSDETLHSSPDSD